MSLGAVATAVVVPPLNLLPLGFAGFLLARRWPRLGRVLMAVSLLGLFAFSLPVTSRSLIASLEWSLPRAPPDQPPAAIVILGGDAGYGTDVGLETGTGIGALTFERMRAGALLQRRTGLPVLVTGGVLEPGTEPIAAQMARGLHDEFGIAVRWVEPASDDTWQNAQFSAAMLHAAGINSVFLVSHAWHLRRAAMAFARFGIAITPAPLRYDRPPRFSFDEFMPHASAVLNSYFALHEWIGIFTMRSVPDLDALPAGFAAADNFFASETWWRTVLAAGMPPGAEARFLLCADAVLMPLQLLDGGRTLQSLTNPYTGLYQPLIAPGLSEAALRQAGAEFGRFCRAWPTVRLDALADDFLPLAPLLAGARRAGMLASRFAHFGNWHEPVAGRSWEQYLAARPGALRETVRRKLRRTPTTLEIVATPDAVAAGIDAYEEIYARSWKVPEPYPLFHAEMMRRAADVGVLRLGLLRAGGRVVAAQIWIVQGGRAAVLKLAHDEADRALSPGTVLTALMIRELIGHDGITELDFGRGDDPYKQLWATERRQRIGIVLANPWRPRGLIMLGRQVLGHARRRLAARLPARSRSGFASAEAG